ncbi:glycoside hydrolase family 2 protein [Trematosphaeria pertusa]|uniref:Glycoside hydrolase family 2 protein n=1 Tax=Trematosphaeria pertusa TaxID=390896 RepID=A0A6A6IGV4_9PLEO|nr:glycoside hydrolase family 2 protein [Trematosphaeria pertusa]KAF2248763.1 glycoside hydrolase family 2 protein [Trematosphaeria pertusa]
MATYPRPDFERPYLNWISLNGLWSFLFDDNDIGLTQGWHLSGLPSEVVVDPTLGSSSSSSSNKESESITAKIAANPHDLIKGNTFKKEEEKTTHKKLGIVVPYVWQCLASRIEERGVHEVFWYEREIADLRSTAEKSSGERVLLRFGAVDYEAKVWVGGQFVGGHRGGHVPFDIDITDAFASAETQSLTLRVYDSAYDLTQPRGKQYWGAQPESIFYTPSGGIWQSVWMEVVPPVRIGDSSSGTVLRSDDIEGGKLKASVRVLGRPAGYGYAVEMEVSLGGVVVSKTEKVELPRETDMVSFDADMRLSGEQRSNLPATITETAPLDDPTCWLNNTALWTPEHPTLYDLTLRLFNATGSQVDEIHTTAGMRSLSWTSSTFRLNNRPYFQALLLDQGYWPTTFMTPPTPSALKHDIQLSKAMGFNGCRKHQKVEDPIFLYYADRLGFLVWGEMANAYQFSSQYVERFDAEWREAVKRDINHPCVVAWTPVNESWGYTNLKDDVEQRNHIRSLYYATKTLDPSRPINDNCGWEHVCTDLSTFHDYSDGEALTQTCVSLEGILAPKSGRGIFVPSTSGDPGSRHKDGAPVLCTEFGGINIARDTTASGVRDWGYTTASDPKDLLKRIETMMAGIVKGGHICGFVYTQLTDIEQEVNGLYTPDRKEKLDPAEMRKIVDGVKQYYHGLHK